MLNVELKTPFVVLGWV